MNVDDNLTMALRNGNVDVVFGPGITSAAAVHTSVRPFRLGYLQDVVTCLSRSRRRLEIRADLLRRVWNDEILSAIPRDTLRAVWYSAHQSDLGVLFDLAVRRRQHLYRRRCNP